MRHLSLRDDDVGEHAIDGAAFRGACLPTDYASFLAWNDWGRPEEGVRDCFAELQDVERRREELDFVDSRFAPPIGDTVVWSIEQDDWHGLPQAGSA